MKKELITHLLDFRERNKFEHEQEINSKDFALLMEAYRRKHVIAQTAKHNNNFTGHGMPSVYKNSKLFEPSFGPTTPRCAAWFKLNKRGLELMKILEERYMHPPQYENELLNELNKQLYQVTA